MKIIISIFLLISFFSRQSFAKPKPSKFDVLKNNKAKKDKFLKVQEIFDKKEDESSIPDLGTNIHHGENLSFKKVERKQYFNLDTDPSKSLNNVGTLLLDPSTGSIDWDSIIFSKGGNAPGRNNDKDNERRNPNYQRTDWLSRLQKYNVTKPFLFYINYSSPEPFMSTDLVISD